MHDTVGYGDHWPCLICLYDPETTHVQAHLSKTGAPAENTRGNDIRASQSQRRHSFALMAQSHWVNGMPVCMISQCGACCKRSMMTFKKE